MSGGSRLPAMFPVTAPLCPQLCCPCTEVGVGGDSNHRASAIPFQEGDWKLGVRGAHHSLASVSSPSHPSPVNTLTTKPQQLFKRTVIWKSQKVSGICETAPRFIQIHTQGPGEYGMVRDNSHTHTHARTHAHTGVHRWYRF